jgi:hypothetical protein
MEFSETTGLKPPSSEAVFAAEAEATAKKERDIQRKIERSDKQHKGGKEEGGAIAIWFANSFSRRCPLIPPNRTNSTRGTASASDPIQS